MATLPEDLEVPAGGATSRRPRSRANPAGPPRKSARLHGPEAAVHSVERAERRAAVRNLEGPGSSSSSFAVLQDLPDSHLTTVVHDAGLAFAVEAGTESEVLSLIRAKEKAQAAIAEAIFRRDAAVAEAAAAVAREPDEVVGATAEGEVEPVEPAAVPLAKSMATPTATTRGTAKSKVAARRGRRRTPVS